MSPQTIMVVDDLVTLRQPVRIMLERAGYSVEEASSGKEALDKMTESNPDLVLLDLMMPIMNGIEVIKRMKTDSVMQNIPVIILTAVADKSKLERYAKLKTIDYLLKPFTSLTLLERVRRMLQETSPPA